MKGDWSEISSTFGLPQWNSINRPCYCCNTSRSRLYELSQVAVGEWEGVRLNTAADYASACNRAEIITIITEADRNAITPLLRYAKRDRGPPGGANSRALM